ncbi:hypothetical protein O6H91_18G026400 [Diphasiastrum complanatum]|nr:hypothetical protein O6H91_18G026400 [Diphasiastrum complanatum]
MGITRNGRLAFITNFREPETLDQAISRGELTTRFLKGSQSPIEYLEEVASEADKYNGFNLVVADLSSRKMGYLSNRPKNADILVRELAPGIYGLSNALLDSMWPKVQFGKGALQRLTSKFLDGEIPERCLLEDILKDNTRASYELLPDTGYGLDWEHKLSSICVDCDTVKGQYGTRSMNVIAVRKNGQVSFFESFIEDGVWKDHRFEFEIETC